LPIAYVVVVAAAAKASSQALRGVHPLRAWFNVAQWSVAAAAGSLVFGALTDSDNPDHRQSQLGALIVAMVIVAFVNALCLLGVVVLVQRAPDRGWLPRHTFSRLPPLVHTERNVAEWTRDTWSQSLQEAIKGLAHLPSNMRCTSRPAANRGPQF